MPSCREEHRRKLVECRVMPQLTAALSDADLGVRAAACACVRSLSRSIRVLRCAPMGRAAHPLVLGGGVAFRGGSACTGAGPGGGGPGGGATRWWGGTGGALVGAPPAGLGVRWLCMRTGWCRRDLCPQERRWGLAGDQEGCGSRVWERIWGCGPHTVHWSAQPAPSIPKPLWHPPSTPPPPPTPPTHPPPPPHPPATPRSGQIGEA